jgi:hypothetical protein
MCTMTKQPDQNSLEETRQVAAKHLEEAKEMADDIAKLCQQASCLRFPLKKGLNPSTNSNAKERKRLGGH